MPEVETRPARRRREVVERSDGKLTKITKPPRADVLWYPRNRWTTVLVRRTHDLGLARRLAEERWAEIDDPRPLSDVTRKGWWTTWATKDPPPAAGVDYRGRAVLVCDDTDHAASPGIEFRP